MDNDNQVVSQKATTPKGKKRNRRARMLWVALPGGILLFALVFSLISRLSAQRVVGGKRVELASGVPIDPRKLETIQKRFSNLADSTVPGDDSPKADDYVKSLLGGVPESPEPESAMPELDTEVHLNRTVDVEPVAESTPVSPPPPAQGEKEASMMVYSRGQKSEATEVMGATPLSAKMVDSAKAVGQDVGRLTEKEAGAESRLAMVIYNGLPPVRVFEGEFLDGVIQNRIVSQVADSPVVASIAKDFFDGSQRYVVIPSGTRVVGSAGTVTRQDQARMILSFHRLILPNGESVLIQKEQLKGLSQDGSVGMVSSINEHLGKRYGHALLFGILDGLAALGQNKLSQSSRGSFFVDRTSSNFNRINSQIFSQYGNILPTITVEAGHKVKIYMTEDILMSPYMPIKERGYAK